MRTGQKDFVRILTVKTVQVIDVSRFIGFRIVLPIFASMLVVNSILAILAKVAPQMSMFVIGLQLKVFVGLVVLVLMVMMITGVTDLIFREMISMIRDTLPYLGGVGE